MATIITNLRLQSDTSTIVHPNIEAGNIPNLSIDASKIAADSISATKIATSAVINSKIAPQAVTRDKIAVSAIGTSEIADNSITRSKLQNNSVGRAQLRFIDDYVIDIDYGDTALDFHDWLLQEWKRGMRLYFDDGTTERTTVDGISFDNHGSVILHVSLPLQGMSNNVTIDSSNISTFFSSGYGQYLHICGVTL